jgi:hypothetical protein
MNFAVQRIGGTLLLSGSILMHGPGAALAQGTNQTGTANLSGTVSNFVELTSNGSATLSGNTVAAFPGSTSTPQSGAAGGDALLVNIDLGEIGPNNTSLFVRAQVPLQLRSNGAYVLSIQRTTFTTSSDILPQDVGFGLVDFTRLGIGTIAGTDMNGTQGDPTLAANGSPNPTTGRYEYTQAKGDLADFGTATSILNGSRILSPVPRLNAGGLNFNAVFSVKPQFFQSGTFNATVVFTASAP